ncbi:hemerythrin [Sphaerisporangium melleum]|uniref:Hemerythrin n=1 Tax=Sphaerisporangium melleum TaxID=321316 RepID=A0A917REM4_9ACTN|nr:hemerythrin domain-containing protein [Sphaerisporangium melleum]GGL02750.1 hemerythrin [Sphaerisporangium melleum]GII69483.1 hemerythrin [Sphaerisporangium melleum]
MIKHGGDVITVLTTDHREVEEIFAELEALREKRDDDLRRELTEKVITELVRHSVAEEAYLYPAARKFLPDGDRLADREIAEHVHAERLMKQLEGADVTDPAFEGLLDDFMTTVRQHIREEEAELFPELVKYADAEELHDLGKKVTAMKKIAPTRPHPGAPHHPPANKLLAPGAGLVDRIRDLITGRSTL